MLVTVGNAYKAVLYEYPGMSTENQTQTEIQDRETLERIAQQIEDLRKMISNESYMYAIPDAIKTKLGYHIYNTSFDVVVTIYPEYDRVVFSLPYTDIRIEGNEIAKELIKLFVDALSSLTAISWVIDMLQKRLSELEKKLEENDDDDP